MASHRLRAVRLAALVFGTAAPVVLLGAVGFSQQNGSQASPPPFKNVRLLKGLSHEDLIARMRIFNASLGVECTFCHVRNADHTGWELDTKPEKRTARQMILLTEDLNKHQRVIAGKATCFMCHHGQREPQTRPEGGGDRN